MNRQPYAGLREWIVDSKRTGTRARASAAISSLGHQSLPPKSRLAGVLILAAAMALTGVGLGGEALADDSSPAAAPVAPQQAIRNALEKAKADYETLDRALRAEGETRRARVGSAIATNESLRQRESQLRAELETARTQNDRIGQESEDLEAALAQPRGQTAALRTEILRQATLLAERFEGSLVSAEKPELLDHARTLKASATQEEVGPADELLDRLLDAFDIVLEASIDASTFIAPVQLAGGQGKIDDARVLRLGLLGGYYEHAETGEAGFLLPSEGNTRLVGHNAGITASQQAAITELVRNPEGGGSIPIDVTGGAGLAALRLRDTLTEWFEKGGEFMWALLAIAIVAVVLVLERSLVLAIRTMGLRRQIDQVVELVESGKLVEAEALCTRMGGAAGGVLHSALAHRDRDRSVIEDAVQEALLHHAPKFQARLSFIALCAAVSPLLGLLGTVSGMIGTFQAVTVFGTSDPRYMAGGISVALITTQAGLYLAIPCLLFRGALGAVAEGALGRLEAGAMSVVLALLNARVQPAAELTPAARSTLSGPKAPRIRQASPTQLASRTPAHSDVETMPEVDDEAELPRTGDGGFSLDELESADALEEERQR